MRALVVPAPGGPAALADVPAPLPADGEVQIAVAHSSLNWKDGATVVGRPGFVRTAPLTVGIDAVGTVIASRTDRHTPGDRVVLTGGGAGETRHGGLAEVTTADGDVVVPLPGTLDTEQAAALGTAGLTAALAVLAIEDHGLTPADGDVLVTGASGGLGGLAVGLLAGRGFRVVASTGRAEEEREALERLGAAEVRDREELAAPADAPLASQRFAAVVDGVGSHTLAGAIAALRRGGLAVACGLAQGSDLPTSVLPFILRGVTLAGIASVDAPRRDRERAWALLAEEVDREALAARTRVIGLEDVLVEAPRLLAGRVAGRTVVDVHG